jgi:hypothetical protein
MKLRDIRGVVTDTFDFHVLPDNRIIGEIRWHFQGIWLVHTRNNLFLNHYEPFTRPAMLVIMDEETNAGVSDNG